MQQAVQRQVRAAVEPADRTIRLALAGCGTVGGALLEQLTRRSSAIAHRHGIRIDVVRILVRDERRDRGGHVPRDLVTTDLHEFLATDCDIVVEAIGGTDTAVVIARHALMCGRALVTANKALLAARGAELADLARRHDAPLSFEASVAGAVPIVRVLRDALPHAGVSAVRGVLNGTTNYLLTRMHAGATFEAALAEAQRFGYAEADPARDLDGRDAADKVAVLAWQAFGVPPGRVHVETRGLLPWPDRIVADAVALGGVARSVGEARRNAAGVSCTVEPVVVNGDSPLAGLVGADNLVEIETAAAATIRLAGPGAGGDATASALLADILAAAPSPPAPARNVGPAADTRRHRWSISVPAARREELAAAAHRIRVPAADVTEDGLHVRLLTEPVDRSLAGALVRALELQACEPVLLRVER
jgi:homoserine dehydrogenase